MGLLDEFMELEDGGTPSIYEKMIESHYEDRKLVINSDISDALLEDVCLSILNWNKEDKLIPVEARKPIFLYINSSGGSVIMGMTLLDVITNSKTPVITVGFSQCSSMACYILAAGKKRYCFPHTVVLLHDGQNGFFTSANKGKDIQRFFERLDDKGEEFLIGHTKMDKEFLDSIRDREFYMFADEAKEHGIIDEVIGVDCDISVLNADVFK